MRKPKQDLVLRRFKRLDFHDDGLLSVRIRPPHTKTNNAVLELELQDYETKAHKTLSFRRCGNLRIIMDFDVLANNWFAQTDQATCETSVARMRQYVKSQMGHWHVKYMPPSPKNKPIQKKLAGIGGYRLFRVTFFGGTIEVLAKYFEFKSRPAA
jgi:hypothetical protein